ncbi:transcription termination/antitermination NusG family protein [Candidatus Allofournierella excrementavium]|uniref:transcription termination/antitermination NusG family protein n=1 Tax=Candidatus Allofournierella excrementavium TaxID=2838591 RepID=UPI003AB4ABCD
MRAWYVLQVMTGTEQEVCGKLRRTGVQARAPEQKIQIRRHGQWQEETRLLIPGYVFVSAEYTPALYHRLAPIAGVIRWLGLEDGLPQALDANEALRWGLDTGEEIELSTVAFFPGGWRVLDGPLREFEQQIVQMDRRQRRATVRTEILGHPRRLRFGITEALP